MRAMLASTTILLLALSGCASHASGHPRGNQATSTVSTGASSPTATATTTASSSQQTNTTCSANGGSLLTIKQVSVGRYADFGLDTWEQLPDTLALKPQILSQVTPVALGGVNNTASIRVDFNAPPASQPAYVCGVTARITSFQPLSG